MVAGDDRRWIKWSGGENYEAYVGRWSRFVAREFLGWLALPVGQSWLDVGCGTGALVGVVLEQAGPLRVEGVDRSEGYVSHATAHVPDPRASFRVGDAQDLPFADGEFDAAVSGLVLNFVGKQARMVAEMSRVVRDGGTVGAYVWDYAGEMQMMRRFWDAAVALDPAAADLDEGRRFPSAGRDALSALFKAAGLEEVTVRAIDIETTFADFDDFWAPFLGGEGSAPTYCMSLSEGRREALREHLRSSIASEPDGSIRMLARAWAVKGRVA